MHPKALKKPKRKAQLNGPKAFEQFRNDISELIGEVKPP